MTASDLIYLDYNATAPIRPQVIELMSEVMLEGGNPSSVHARGRKAKSRLEAARSQIASMINCRPQMIIFTSGGTEANNMAILNCERSRLITTNAEHDSVNLSKDQFTGTVDMLSVNKDGLIDLTELKKLLQKDAEKTIVSILFANNETGIIQDIAAISEITKDAGALLHVDAIQAFGKIPIDFTSLNVDMMSISSHKIGGPQGVGALIALVKIPVRSPIVGGGQEVGRRGGTENIAGIAGFGLAASLLPQSLEKMKQLEVWRNSAEHEIEEKAAGALFFGRKSHRIPNVSTIYMPNVKSETQVMNFDLDKICVSSGSACSSGKVKASHVILAMTNDDDIASSTVRMSMGWNTEKEDLDTFVKSWLRMWGRKNK